ncbi:10141_t:CDS:2 [Paraglomus occultum]|uniref:UDP-N-acetylglucosamine transferase subunit ALG13 n=1 Tax=Paraglomus occultum TaxID=144539 RepID=A0A9N9FF64_9GLOM|nr:10141_t:CDS:2 [Paraglomus occultum]
MKRIKYNKTTTRPCNQLKKKVLLSRRRRTVYLTDFIPSSYRDAMSGKSIFVTVGSTGFHSLTALIISQPFLQLASSLYYHNIIVQHGSHTMNLQLPESSNVRLESYDYKPSLQEDYERADLIISHAGAGSILESLRLKKPLIVVINDLLMDNHQVELALELHQQKYLICTSVSHLLETLKSRSYETLKPFPRHDELAFARILDRELGLN